MYKRNIEMNGKMCEVLDIDYIAGHIYTIDLDYTVAFFKSYVDIYGNVIPDFVLPFRKMSDYAEYLPGVYINMYPLNKFKFVSNNNVMQETYPILSVVYPFKYIYDNGRYTISMIPGYDTSKMIDITNVTEMRKIIDMDTKYRESEFSIITSGDNITTFKITKDDTPAMAAIKEALNSKKIDFDKYKNRIGPTYANDKRAMEHSNSITLPKAVSLAEAMDMSITITIDNADKNVPNPMPKPIVAKLTDTKSISNPMDNYENDNQDNDQDDYLEEDEDYD